MGMTMDELRGLVLAARQDTDARDVSFGTVCGDDGSWWVEIGGIADERTTLLALLGALRAMTGGGET